MLTAFPLQNRNSWQLSLLELPPCCVPTRNTVTLSSDSLDMYTSIVQSSSSSANAALSPHPRLQTSYPRRPTLYLLPLPLHHRPLLLAVLLRLVLPLPPDSLRVLQWNAVGLRARSTKLSLVSFCWPYPYPRIPSSLIFLFPDSWILCSAFWSHPLPVWHSLSWCHARQQRRHHRQAGLILFWTFYFLSFFARSLL